MQHHYRKRQRHHSSLYQICCVPTCWSFMLNSIKKIIQVDADAARPRWSEYGPWYNTTIFTIFRVSYFETFCDWAPVHACIDVHPWRTLQYKFKISLLFEQCWCKTHSVIINNRCTEVFLCPSQIYWHLVKIIIILLWLVLPW